MSQGWTREIDPSEWVLKLTDRTFLRMGGGIVSRGTFEKDPCVPLRVQCLSSAGERWPVPLSTCPYDWSCLFACLYLCWAMPFF